jgi:hypothetical protein
VAPEARRHCEGGKLTPPAIETFALEGLDRDAASIARRALASMGRTALDYTDNKAEFA